MSTFLTDLMKRTPKHSIQLNFNPLIDSFFITE